MVLFSTACLRTGPSHAHACSNGNVYPSFQGDSTRRLCFYYTIEKSQVLWTFAGPPSASGRVHGANPYQSRTRRGTISLVAAHRETWPMHRETRSTVAESTGARLIIVLTAMRRGRSAVRLWTVVLLPHGLRQTGSGREAVPIGQFEALRHLRWLA